MYFVKIITSFKYILREYLIDFGNLNWFLNIISHANSFGLVFIRLITECCRRYDRQLE